MPGEDKREAIGERIRRLRLERGLSQSRLVGPGVSASYLSRVEKGERTPSVKALRLIAAKLGVGAEYLEKGIDVSEQEARLADAELELRLGEPSRAAEAFGQVISDAGESSELAERARIGLALVRASEGRSAEAIDLFEEVLSANRPLVAERPDFYAVLGRSYAAVGEPTRAARLFQRCLDEIGATELIDRVLYVRFATYLSYALTDVGDTSGANQALLGALAQAEGLEDRHSEIRLNWSLARMYGAQGPPELALAYYRRAIVLLEATEDRFYLARAHEACGSALLDQSDPQGAREHLEIAESIYREQRQGAYVASVRAEWARLELQAGEIDSARQAALEALDLLDEGAGDPDDVGNVWRTLGEILAHVGKLDLAEQAFRRSVEALSEGAPVKYLADACRSYADFLHSAGRETEAFNLMKRAASLATTPPRGPSHAEWQHLSATVASAARTSSSATT